MRRWITAIFLLLAVGGGLTVLFVGRAREQQALREDAHRKRLALEALIKQIDARVSTMPPRVDKITRHAELVHHALVQSRIAGAFVRNDRASAEKKPEVRQKDDTAGTPQKKQEQKQPQKPPQKPPPKKPPRRDITAPAGIMTREQLERMRGHAVKKDKGEAQKPDPGGAAKQKPTSAPKKRPAPSAPAVRTAQVVARELAAVSEACRVNIAFAPQLLADAQAAQKDPAGGATREALTALLQHLQQLSDDLDVCVEEVREGVSRISELSRELDAFSMAAARSRNETAVAEIEAAEEERMRKLIAAEVASLEPFRKKNQKRLDSHAYLPLADLAAERSQSCRTDAGREVFHAAELRYRKLAWLKKYISKRINAEPMKWGWGIDREAVDILAANAKGIRTPLEEIPWSKVSPAQFLAWSQRYSSEFPIEGQTLGDLRLAEAVFFYEHGAMAEASRRRAEAVQEWRRSEAEADRLFPDL